MTEHDGYEVLAAGTWGSVVGIRRPNGSCPSLDWLRELTDAQQGGMKARLDRLAETGDQKTPENFRKVSLDGQPVVYEVKHTGHNLRLFVIKGHHMYYATHGTIKPKKKTLPREVQRARDLYEERQ